MTRAFPVLADPGHAPVILFRITWTDASGRQYDAIKQGEAALLSLMKLCREILGDLPADFKVELIAARPINVTGSYLT